MTACQDCGVDTLPTDRGTDAEYYMVHNAIWAQAGMAPDGGFLCVGCLERRLGRQLDPGDFTDSPINNPAMHHAHHAWSWRTRRLQDRISGQGRLFP